MNIKVKSIKTSNMGFLSSKSAFLVSSHLGILTGAHSENEGKGIVREDKFRELFWPLADDKALDP